MKLYADQRVIALTIFQNTKQYELDFRERRGKNGLKIKSSVKNFQLTLEV